MNSVSVLVDNLFSGGVILLFLIILKEWADLPVVLLSLPGARPGFFFY